MSRPGQRRATLCRAVDQLFSKFASQAYLDKAAQRFRVGLENGIPEDDLVAIELGAASLEDLSEVQRQYVDKLKERLLLRAEELKREEAARRAREAQWFEAGKDAYARGEYPDSVQYFERAIEETGRQSALGGETLMWLALAYQAVGREQDCIDTYKWIEANHPLPKMRKQAENLRYIMEAPKLELSPDERVTIPLLNSQDSWRRDARKSGIKPRSGGAVSNQEPSYWDKVDWNAKLPFVPDKWYYRVLWVALIIGSTIYFNYTARGH